MTLPKSLAAVALALSVPAAAANVFMSLKSSSLGFQTLKVGDRVGVPSGATVDGLQFLDENRDGYKCFVLRYASVDCRFCELDEPMFQRLQNELDRGCLTVMMSPTPQQMPRPSRREWVMLGYPRVAFSSAVPFVMTPTTVLLDKTGTVLWSKTGILTDDDLRGVTGALRKQVGWPGPRS